MIAMRFPLRSPVRFCEWVRGMRASGGDGSAAWAVELPLIGVGWRAQDDGCSWVLAGLHDVAGEMLVSKSARDELIEPASFGASLERAVSRTYSDRQGLFRMLYM